jgi:hypothetical protein
MRLAIIKMDKSEIIFYNLPIFKEYEDLIVFPYDEFLKSYDETLSYLKIISKVLKEVQADPPVNPQREFEIIQTYLENVQKFIDPLLKFETQTTLESFNKKLNPVIRRKTVSMIDKGNLQCLIGLEDER